jgi:nucleotide-binding universal stress UspA family protein
VRLRRAGHAGPAIRWASAEADRRNQPLTLVCSWDVPFDIAVDIDQTAMPELSGPATCRAIQDPASLADLYRDADLLVMDGTVTAERTSRADLHHTTGPVVVVPDTERAPTGRVVVGVCGTPASRAALAWAADEARLRWADLVVVEAWQLHPASAREFLRPARSIAERQKIADGRLRRWVGDQINPALVELHSLHGAPLDRLLELGVDADLIVLGRHAHGPLSQLVHGSVGDDLMRLAQCPVAVVPDHIDSS